MKIETITNEYGTLLFHTEESKVERMRRELTDLTWEPAVTAVLEKTPYDIFIDIGAGFGYYSMMASPYAEKVVAIEPHPIRYGLCRWNTKDLDNVEVIEVAVAGQPYVSNDPVEMSGSKGGEFTIPLNVKVENVLNSFPYLHDGNSPLVKIDAEGFEVDILEDIFRYLPICVRDRIMFIVEYHRDWKHYDVQDEDILQFFDDTWVKEKIGTRNHWLIYKGESNGFD